MQTSTSQYRSGGSAEARYRCGSTDNAAAAQKALQGPQTHEITQGSYGVDDMYKPAAFEEQPERGKINLAQGHTVHAVAVVAVPHLASFLASAT